MPLFRASLLVILSRIHHLLFPPLPLSYTSLPSSCDPSTLDPLGVTLGDGVQAGVTLGNGVQAPSTYLPASFDPSTLDPLGVTLGNGVQAGVTLGNGVQAPQCECNYLEGADVPLPPSPSCFTTDTETIANECNNHWSDKFDKKEVDLSESTPSFLILKGSTPTALMPCSLAAALSNKLSFVPVTPLPVPMVFLILLGVLFLRLPLFLCLPLFISFSGLIRKLTKLCFLLLWSSFPRNPLDLFPVDSGFTMRVI